VGLSSRPIWRHGSIGQLQISVIHNSTFWSQSPIIPQSIIINQSSSINPHPHRSIIINKSLSIFINNYHPSIVTNKDMKVPLATFTMCLVRLEHTSIVACLTCEDSSLSSHSHIWSYEWMTKCRFRPPANPLIVPRLDSIVIGHTQSNRKVIG